ncbi:hypothetical protein [Clostridium sp. 'White wine YQ']|uniref:hypothetical protein n=1 Tax=Clostridium sp. 'White wine YQ' TaxID=3027474 RepID=UPI002365D547|nr:hypothetical protein [Clostridium sp. 'White wine YQ']MDD7793453.1 hypothetical protein [Clostridium sp. 'White wine YQ']
MSIIKNFFKFYYSPDKYGKTIGELSDTLSKQLNSLGKKFVDEKSQIHVSSEDEKKHVFESLAKEVSLILNSENKPKDITKESLCINKNMTNVIALIFNGYIDKNEKDKIQMINRVLLKYYGYLAGSGTDRLIPSMELLAEDLIEYCQNKGILSTTRISIEARINENYNEAVNKILYTVGNALSHHANISDHDYQAVKQSPFMEKYVMFYAREVFAKGYIIGRMKKYGEEEQYIDNANKHMIKTVLSMQEEAKGLFSKKIAECFSIGTQKSFEEGFAIGYDE